MTPDDAQEARRLIQELLDGPEDQPIPGFRGTRERARAFLDRTKPRSATPQTQEEREAEQRYLDEIF